MGEVVVIGGGNAGIPAAIFAADAGHHVTIIEKTGELGGTLWFTSHSISGAGTKMQARKGIQDSPEQHYADVWRIGGGKADPEILRVAMQGAAAGIDWLEDIGVPFTEASPFLTQGHAVYSVPRTHSPVPVPGAPGSGPGRQVLIAFEREIERRVATGQISVQYLTAAEELVTGADGRVTGVSVTRNGERRVIPADAVVLATGSYGANRAMLERYIPDFPEATVSICPPHATGDGIVLAEAAGGALTHMDMYVVVFCGVADRRSLHLAVYWIMLHNVRPPASAGDIWVNRLGKRFIREDETSPDARERALMAQPGGELFTIFDAPMRAGLTEQVAASMKLQVEGRTPNFVYSANTIEELAVKLNIPPTELRATVDRYNAAVESGHDPELGRRAMPKRIDTPPYHAIPAAGVIFLTHGGVKINLNGQVVRPDGSAFPNLFAAGDVTGAGQVVGEAFAGGQGVGAALTFGILAGKNAARVASGEAL